MNFAPLTWVQKLLPKHDEARLELPFRRDRRQRDRTGPPGLFGPVRRSILRVAVCLLIAAAAVADPTPTLEVKGMTFVASRENNDAVILHAEHARFETEAKQVHLRGVDARIPATADQRGFRLRCDTGVVDLASNDFEVAGNVRGEVDSGEHFEVAWVRYDHEKGVLYTEAPVLMTHRGTTFRGGGFTYDIARRRFHLLGGAQVVQDIDEMKKAMKR